MEGRESLHSSLRRNGFVLFLILAPLPGLIPFEWWCLRG